MQKTYRPIFHIQPPTGWLNDPNGSCYYDGKYHIYFQYSPDNPNGGQKYWGHYESTDLAHFEYTGILISPDHEYDKDGVYSGTAWANDDGELTLYYTGNVKHPGDYDYINEGRGHNVLRVTTKDGRTQDKKELILVNSDYPENLSCHVRDPKLYMTADDITHMLLGARTRDSKGGLLFMQSEDEENWEVEKLFLPEDDFGFMLECPDYFALDGARVVAFCPQGMQHEKYRFQNVYESGYVVLDTPKASPKNTSEGVVRRFEDADRFHRGSLEETVTIPNFHEWDMGFDFYAPQTFTAPDGRQILIGWAGVPDAEYGNAPAIEEGWQHTMTVPRELTLIGDRIYSMPVQELEDLRGEEIAWTDKSPELKTSTGAWDVEIRFGETESADSANLSDASEDASIAKTISLNQDIEIRYQDGILTLEHKNNTGDGRTIRHAEMKKLTSLRLLFDVSMIEIYANDGEVAMTTRYYVEDPESITLTGSSIQTVTAYEMTRGVTL